MLRVIPHSRWDVDQVAHYLRDSSPEVAGRVRNGGFLTNARLFDNGIFNISKAEASAMDPQQRQVLELGYLALHAAGLARSSLLGSLVAVGVGQWTSEFGDVLDSTPAGGSVYATTGYQCSVTCGRISFALDLHGPCASYDTA